MTTEAEELHRIVSASVRDMLNEYRLQASAGPVTDKALEEIIFRAAHGVDDLPRGRSGCGRLAARGGLSDDRRDFRPKEYGGIDHVRDRLQPSARRAAAVSWMPASRMNACG
jgi:hypothetical protein